MLNYGIDWQNPISNHPLNRGLVAWWLVGVPGRSWGGTTWRDLTNRYHGTLTNMDPATDWRNNAIRFDATGKGVEVAASAELKQPLPLSFAVTLRTLGIPTDNSGLFGVIHNNTDSAPYGSYTFYYGSGMIRVSANSAGTFFSVDSGISSAAEFIRLTCVWEAAGLKIYSNGQQVYSDSTSRSDPTYGATALMAAGNYTGISRNSNIEVKSGSIWNRALSPSEVMKDYIEDKTLLPNLLNRIPMPSYAPAAAPGGFVDNTWPILAHLLGA